MKIWAGPPAGIYTFFLLKRFFQKKKYKYILQVLLLWCMWSQIFVRFALSVTVSEISTFCTKMATSATLLNFGRFEIFWKFSQDLDVFEILKNVVLWSLMMHVIPNFRPFRSISNDFRVLNFNFKIEFF